MITEKQILHQNSPRQLSNEEINNPLLVINEFFTFNRLHECREELRNWFYSALAEHSITETGNPATLFSFYERVEKLIEAAYIIKERDIS